MRRRVVSVAWMVAATVTGLVWRMAPLHLPWFWFKYGGSMLWAVALYWLVAAVFARQRVWVVAAIAMVAAAAVEFSRLWHTPGFDAFRETLVGKLLLGRFFSLKNVVAYWVAIGVVAVMDGWGGGDRDGDKRQQS